MADPIKKKGYKEDDAAEETDVKVGKVKKVWHQAREDAQNSDNETDKKLTKNWKRKTDAQEQEEKEGS